MTANTNNLSQITDAVWMIEVGDELHWEDCKKIGTMDEWNKAVEHFNERHNENFISSIFTNNIHTVVKMFYLYDTDSEDEEEVCCLSCYKCGIGIVRDSEIHDNCIVINDGDDVVCPDCKIHYKDDDDEEDDD